MVMTTSGSQPDKHITPGQAQGPAGNGRYNLGNPNAPMNSADTAAANVYGNPDAPDGTRMSRMHNIAKEAVQSDGTTESYGPPAFVEPTQDWSLTPNKTVNNSGDMPTSPGFPGNDPSDAEFSYLGQPAGNQGKDISQPVSTKPAASNSNVNSPQFSGKGY